MKYTQEQDEIIKSNEAQLRIIAGPGCGKTTVIVGRIVELLHRGVSPENISVFCFAKHDKANVISRLRKFIGYDTINKIVINNYHGFGLSLIRKYGIYGKPGEEVKLLEENESYAFIRRELENYCSNLASSKDEADFLFKKAKRLGLVDTIFDSFNMIRDEGCLKLKDSPKISTDLNYIKIKIKLEEKIYEFNESFEKLEESSEHSLDTDFFSIEKLFIFANSYYSFCESYGYVDFMDMILQSYFLLKENNNLLMDISAKAEHVLVDEFQDISCLQFELINLITNVNKRIFAVGDVDQCIYEWRNAKPFYMKEELPRRYLNLVSLPLSINFRSDANIVESANKLIVHNKDRLNFSLKPYFQALEPIKHKKVPSILDQATDISILIERLLGSRSNYFTEKDHKIAIIVRSARSVSSNLIRNALFKKQIPVQMRFESKIIEKIMSIVCNLCNLTVDPKSPSDLYSVLSILPGFGEKTMDKLRLKIEAGYSIYDATTSLKIKGDRLKLVEALSSYVSDLNQAYNKNKNIIISELNFFNRNFNLSQVLRDNFSQGKGVLENTALIDATIDEISLSEDKFIDYRDTLTAGLSALNHIEEGKKPSVLLCTTHHAKGGEWDIVICPDFVNGNGGFPVSKNDFEDEEERRICYVAITRAKKHLYLYSYATDIQREPIGQSHFIREMEVNSKNSTVLGSSASNLYNKNYIVKKKRN